MNADKQFGEVYYRFEQLPNNWVNDKDKTFSDKFFIDKDYEDFYFDNFYDMDQMVGHENSLFGTRGLPVGHPDRSSRSFDSYNKKYGPIIVRILKNEKLQENISRIKEVMGIINEGEITSFKRRLGELPKYINSTLEWLNPKAFNSFDEFLERTIWTTTRDFVITEFNSYNYEEVHKIREDLLPYVQYFIMNHSIDKIKEYYKKGTER